VIVDLEQRSRRRAAVRPPLMGLAIGVITIGLGAMIMRPPADPAETSQARERIASTFVLSTPEPTPVPTARVARLKVPLVTPPRASLPPSLMFPLAVAEALPEKTVEAAQAAVLSAGEGTRQIAYRVPDGRTVVVRQTTEPHRPLLAAYSLDDGNVRGYPAQFITSRTKSLRAMVMWSEGAASYLMYSGSMNIRDLVRLADHLR
jgi:hypothetical protein